MCVPVSVVTGGSVSGCQGICNIWPQISGMVILCAGLVWNFTRGFIVPDKQEKPQAK